MPGARPCRPRCCRASMRSGGRYAIRPCEQSCTAKPSRLAAPLPDDGQVAFAERVVTDQVILGVRQRQQAFALGGGEDRTAGHAVSFFLKTEVCDKPVKATGAAREIKALRFSKIVLEVLFLIAYNLNEFREEWIPMRPSVVLYMKRSAVREAVGRFRTANPRVFGSVLHGTDRDGSELDLLVDALPGATLLDLGDLEEELKSLLGVDVDLLTPGDLPPKFRVKVLAEAQPV